MAEIIGGIHTVLFLGVFLYAIGHVAISGVGTLLGNKKCEAFWNGEGRWQRS